MTGFGEARGEQRGIAVAVEIRSVNNRHFKLAFRGDEVCSAWVPELERLVRSRITRGTVTLSLRVESLERGDNYQIRSDVLEGYRQQLAEISDDADPVPLWTLLQLPGVIDERASQLDAIEDQTWVTATVEESLSRLCTMRTQEGEALSRDLQLQCETIAAELQKVEQRLPEIVEAYQTRLMDRVNKVLEKHNVTVEPADVIREIGLMTERVDLSEEIVRLRSHIDQFLQLLVAKDSVGRKLDFLTQEMFREANTIGSKSSDVEISRHAIQIKSAVERMREQVQNVE